MMTYCRRSFSHGMINDKNVTRTFLRILAFLAVLLVVLPSVAAPRAQYLCHMSGRLLHSSCCGQGSNEVSAHGAPSEAQFSSNCCERLAPAEYSVSARTPDSVDRLPLPGWMAITWERPAYGAMLPDIMAVEAPSARAPPALGPPLFIVHCALLI